MKLSLALFVALVALPLAARGQVYVDAVYGHSEPGAAVYNPRDLRSAFRFLDPFKLGDLQLTNDELNDIASHSKYTYDNQVEFVRPHWVEVLDAPHRVTADKLGFGGGGTGLGTTGLAAEHYDVTTMTIAAATGLNDGAPNRQAKFRVECEASAQQIIPPGSVDQFSDRFYTDPDDDMRFCASTACGFFMTGRERHPASGSEPMVAAARIGMTNKGVWAIAANIERANDGFVQVHRLGPRLDRYDFHEFAVEYDCQTNTMHYEVGGQRLLSIPRWGQLSNKMLTLVQNGDSFHPMEPHVIRGSQAMFSLMDGIDPISGLDDTGLVCLIQKPYVVPTAFDKGSSRHIDRVFGRGTQMQLKRFKFYKVP